MSLADVQSMKALKQLKDISINQLSINLFNPNDSNFINGQQLNLNTLVTASTYFTSGFIPVDMNTQYMFSNVRNYAFYDANRNYISGENLIGGKANAILSIFEYSNTKYIRFSTTTTNLSGAYVYKVPIQQRSKLFGKMIVGIGDSLTGQGYWQPYLRRKLGAFVNTYGVGGTKITDTTGTDTTAMCRDERINAMQNWGDYIILLGGTNDWGQHVALGTVSDTGTNTFYGALKTTAQKLTTRYPTSKIIFVAPPYSLKPGGVGWNDANGYLNNLNLSLIDYGTAMQTVARMYGFPFVDLFANCGWNSINIANYMQNEPQTFIHPNSGEGAERLAIEISRRLEQLANLA